MAIRTYGLSGSGMDIDQMVKDMMKARRASYDKVWQQKTQVEWKKKDFNTLYTLTQDFRNNTIFEFKKQNSLRPLAVASTNDSIISATANADAAAVTHSVVVKQLAEGVTASSSANLTDTAKGKTNDSLVKQFDGIAAGSTLDFIINDKQIKLNVTDTTTMNDVVSSINNAGAGVKANYDATLDRFFLYSDNTGAAAKIDFTGSTADGLTFLQDKLQLGAGFPKTGKDAIINLDGVEVTKSSNTFQVSGVFYNLKTASPKDADGNAVVTKIAVKPDIDKTIANVKEFVDNYNTYLGALNTEINEDHYRDFLPLTDAQKKDMKDSDIQAWEQKAKSGMLRRDPLLSGVVTNMRLSFAEPVEGLTGKYRSAMDIGIGTGSYVDENGKLTTEFSKAGKIYVDPEKLRTALEEDPDAVAKIFGTSGEKTSQSGVAARLYDQLNTSMRQMKEEAGYPDIVDTQSSLAKRLKDFNDRLDNMNRSLAAAEDRYYKQFDAMEQALTRMNQQSSWLNQQLSK